MKHLGPREDPHVSVAEARKTRRGFRFPVAIALAIAIILAITELVRIYR
jgi:hypothetical protein